MNLFQHADYTALRRELKTAQFRCQTRRIHKIQRELQIVMTEILSDELKTKKQLRRINNGW